MKHRCKDYLVYDYDKRLSNVRAQKSDKKASQMYGQIFGWHLDIDKLHSSFVLFIWTLIK